MVRLMTLTSFLILLLVIGVPALMGRGFNLPTGSSQANTVKGAVAGDLPVRVWFPGEGKVHQLALEDYLVGVVAAEMPANFELEALKAQFLVARTYTVRRMHIFGGSGCPAMVTADDCASPETGQAYIGLSDLKTKVGAPTAERTWKRLEAARDATRGMIITYHGAAIDAVYHSSSGGATESALDYWGADVPYLQSVPDPYGKDQVGWQQEKTFSRAELALDLSGLAIPASTTSSFIAITRMTPTGRVSQVRVGDTVLTGRQFREKLGLRSTQFQLQWKDGQLVVTTEGYGHGVGMSQWGANGMAKHQATYDEIVTHYFKGVKIEPIFGE